MDMDTDTNTREVAWTSEQTLNRALTKIHGTDIDLDMDMDMDRDRNQEHENQSLHCVRTMFLTKNKFCCFIA
jgi:hypothetical protein